MALLEDILTDILTAKDTGALSVEEFYVCSPFTVVRLSDGSYGSAGNYAVQNHQPDYDAEAVRRQYAARLSDDPLLLKSLRAATRPASLSLRVAILSALSQRLLEPVALGRAGLTYRAVRDTSEPVQNCLQAGDTVTLIGYGGGLETFCASPRVRRLYVCDFIFQQRRYRDLAWLRIKQLTRQPQRVTLIDGQSVQAPIELSTVCFITGSALCNGTMDGLLASAAGCREVIIQGPSCSLFPPSLFRRSVTMLLTTRKTAVEFAAGMQPGDQIYDFADRHYVAIFPQSRRGNCRL